MSWYHFFLGRLSLDWLPFWSAVKHPDVVTLINDVIATLAASLVLGGGGIVVGLITYFRKWKVLWTEWLTSVDHKRIGIMYIVIAFVMMSRALIEAALMRTQEFFGLYGGFLDWHHFGELFTTHGTIMVFFMGMPFLTGMINFVMPMQIGARDVSFPVMNSVSLGLTAAGAAIMMISLVIGRFSTAGWTGYPPYSETAFSGGVGVDYWIWAVTLSSLGSMMTGINFAVTIYKRRCPGMTWFRLPLFCWTSLCTSILMIFAMPPLTVATALLATDRYLGYHFFTNDSGGNMMNYANLFWMFGHPEVYILILPSFGIYSEVFATFSGKSLYGYMSLVLATMAIAFLSFTVWVHHFFTMGQSAGINATFGIATMLIGVPTGVKVYNWMWTMFRGRVRFTAPLLYGLAFVMLFVIGGLSGVLLANPTIDYQVHNSLFLVAHFHNVLIPGLLFGMLAGYQMWFPKAFGFRLNERWGTIAAFCWIFGFMLAFFPLYVLGLLGFPRRSMAYTDTVYLPYMLIAGFGACVILAGFASLVIQLGLSILQRDQNRVPAGDPWDGRGLEWSISAPPPEYNFAFLPQVTGRDAFTIMKDSGSAYRMPDKFEDIEMDKNSALGFILCVMGGVMAFCLTWRIWWLLAIAGFFALAAIIGRRIRARHEEDHPRERNRTALSEVAARRGQGSRGYAGRRIPARQ